MTKKVGIQHPCLVYIGHEAVFYIPKYKLSTHIVGLTFERELVKDHIHDYLAGNYKAYTVGDSTISGFWMGGKKSVEVFEDKSVEYRVAFEGKPRVYPFISFLANLCYEINEQALYLRMGYKSYLVYGSPVSSKKSKIIQETVS